MIKKKKKQRENKKLQKVALQNNFFLFSEHRGKEKVLKAHKTGA